MSAIVSAKGRGVMNDSQITTAFSLGLVWRWLKKNPRNHILVEDSAEEFF